MAPLATNIIVTKDNIYNYIYLKKWTELLVRKLRVLVTNISSPQVFKATKGASSP